MDADSPAAAGTSLSKGWRLSLFLLSGLLLVNFLVLTRPIRVANTDDVWLSRLGLSGQLFGRLEHESTVGARFYFALPPYQWSNLGFLVPNAWIFALVRATLFFGEWALLGWLVARLTSSAAAGWLLFLVSTCAIHVAPIFNTVLSHPEYAVGSCALYLSLHAYLNYAVSGKVRWLVAAGCAYAWALLNHENFVVYFPLFWAVDRTASWGPQPFGPVLRRSAPILAILTIYVVIYVGFRRMHPSTYGGTQFRLDPASTLVAWFRYNLAAIPGAELFMARQFPEPYLGPRLRTMSEVRSVLAHVPWPSLALSAWAAIAAGFLLVGSMGEAKALPGFTLLCFAWASLASNGLIALTQKYQVLARQRYYPYFYGISAYAWALALLAGLLGYLVWTGRFRRGATLLVGGLLFFLLFWSAAATNAESYRKLAAWYN